MKTFEKSHKLDYVCYDIRGPVMDEAQRMIAQGMDILKLNIGNPAPFGFRAPERVIQKLAESLTNTEGYSDSVTLAGVTAVHYRCDEKQEWYPDIEDMKRKITSKTKGIVVINPNNPTGAVYPKEILEQIVQLARENDLILFADEIYDRLVMDGIEHVSLASLAPDLLTLSFNGLSKSHLIAGYRCGWVCLCGDKSKAGGYIEGGALHPGEPAENPEPASAGS